MSRLLPQSDERRLVVDIGGRSTEMILGRNFNAKVMDSFRLGSVAWSAKYFLTMCFSPNVHTAEVAAKAVLDEALDIFPRDQWDVGYGSKRALWMPSRMCCWPMAVTPTPSPASLGWLKDKLIKAQTVGQPAPEGIKDDASK